MTQKEKGYVGLGVMLVLAAGTVLGSEPLYKAIDSIAAGSVSYEAGTYTGTAQGFGGTVTATVTVTGSGIESVELKGDSETPEIGGAALEKLGPAFVEAGTSRVDAVAGATISSNAAMEAVGQALDQASGKIDVIPAAETEAAKETEKAEETEETEKAEEAAKDVSYVPGTYTGSAQGFGGTVTATVTVTDAGIESVELKGDDETPEIGGAALEKLGSAFVEAGTAKVDAVAGATISSDAAIEAVGQALKEALGEADAKADTQKEAQAAPADVSYKAGTYEGSGKGFGGDVKAVVTITDAGIESVELTGDDETPELGGAALEKLQDMFVSAQSADIDGVSGCTLTSDGAIEAVQAALAQAQ